MPVPVKGEAIHTKACAVTPLSAAKTGRFGPVLTFILQFAATVYLPEALQKMGG
jgi:hypothetical protein